MNNRSIFVVVFALVAGLASAQGWSEAYGKALTALGQGDWAIAKGHFTDAVALRPEDQSDPTSLPGPVTDPRRWRDGAPYSPNFGIAYTSYKLALQLEGVDRNNALAEAGKLFEALMARRQTSVETVYFLNQIYSWTRDMQKLDELKRLVEADTDAFKWKVDRAIITPEERAAVASVLPRGSDTT